MRGRSLIKSMTGYGRGEAVLHGRAITVELSLYDVPTQNCNVHKEVEICGASGHVVNEYCKQVEGNTTKTVGLLDV